MNNTLETTAKREVENLVSDWLGKEKGGHTSKELVERYISLLDPTLLDRLREEMTYNMIYGIVQQIRMRESNYILARRSVFAQRISDGDLDAAIKSPYEAFVHTANGMKRLGDLTADEVRFAADYHAKIKAHHGAKQDFFLALESRMGLGSTVRDTFTENELDDIANKFLAVEEVVV